MTEEEIEDFFDEVAKLDKVWSYIMETNSVFLRTMSEQSSPFVLQHFVPLYGRILLDEKAQDYEYINALCFVDDCVEHGNAALF